MIRLLKRGTFVLTLAASAAIAQSLLDDLTLRVETAADVYNLNLDGVLPQETFDSIDAGDADLRHLVMYDAPANQLSVRTFLVPAGSPLPTSLLVVGNTEVEGFRVDVLDIELHEASRTLTFDGVVAATTRSPVHGASPGDAFRMTVRYDTGALTFAQTRIEIASGTSLLSANGAGFLRVESTPNLAPVAEAGPEVIESSTIEIGLNALQSFDPDGDELDYKWHVLNGAATLRGCETPAPVFQLLQGQGVYDVRLTVTDSRGAASYDFVRIKYVGR